MTGDASSSREIHLFQELIKFFSGDVLPMASDNSIKIFDRENGVLFRIIKEKGGGGRKRIIRIRALDLAERKYIELPPGLGEDPYFSEVLQVFRVRSKDYAIILHFLHYNIMKAHEQEVDPIHSIKEYLNDVLIFSLTERTGWGGFALSDLEDIESDPFLLWILKTLREKYVRAFFMGKYFLGFYHYTGIYWADLGTDPFGFIGDFIGKDLVGELSTERFSSKKEKLRNFLINGLKQEFRPIEGALAFENGVFFWDIFKQTGSLAQALKPHSPDYLVIHYIPWRIALDRLKGLESFLPPRSEKDLLAIFEGIAPKSYKAFRAWVETGNEEETHKNVVLLLEVIGYTLYPHAYPFKKAIMLLGSGDNGKTTYHKVIKKILGKGNYTSLNFDQLTEGRFELAELFGKLANISSEPPKRVGDVERIKVLTGEGDDITAQRKFKDPFQLQNYAKLIFGANRLPKIEDTDTAFWERWIIIDFPNVFPRNPKFFEETFTSEEIEGIIICALYAFYLALERGGFIDNLDYEEIMDRWNRESEVVIKVFAELFETKILEKEEPPLQHFILKDHLTELINDRLRRYGQKPKDASSIYRVLRKRYPYLEKRETQTKVGDRRERAFNGIKILQCDEVERVVGPINYSPCNEWRGDYNVYKYSV